MKRKLLAALTIAAVATLAGCDGGLLLEVDPTAEVADPGQASGDRDWVMELGTDVTATKGEARLEDVRVVGYDADGSEVCRAELGTIEAGTLGGAGNSTTVECEEIPTLVLASVGSITEEEGGSVNAARIRIGAGVYLGQGEGTEILGWEVRPGPHEYDSTTIEEYAVEGDEDGRFSTAPDRGALAWAKCRQYLSDRDRSAVEGDRPWIEAEPPGPDVERRYTLAVHPESAEENDENVPSRSLSSLPPESRELVRATIERMETEDARYVELETNLSRSAYLAEHDGLTDRSVEGLEDVPGEDDQTDTRIVSNWNNTRADCHRFQYDGSDGRRVEYELLIDGEGWEVELRHFDQWSGKIDVPTVDEGEYRDGNESRPEARSGGPDRMAPG